MSNWWTQWAKRIALILAELWTRSRSEDSGDRSAGGAAPADRPVQSNPNVSDAPDAPGANAPH